MEYLYSNIKELNHANSVMVHCPDSFFPSGKLPASYIQELVNKALLSSSDYTGVVHQLSELVNGDYQSFDKLAKLSQLLFSTYSLEDTVLHLYPDELLWHSAYETIRERLDEIAFSN